MTFDEWMITKAAKYQISDDSEALRILRECWKKSAIEERERIAKYFEQEHYKYYDFMGDSVADHIRALGDE